MGEWLKTRPGSFSSEVATFWGALLMPIVSALRPLSSPAESKYRGAHGDADADQHQAETKCKLKLPLLVSNTIVGVMVRCNQQYCRLR
jgi:hypothetical protein